ncbi:aldo/keto reductase [Bacillaceae bacterium SIJ1]|uniref:aldo/keto reductase n=1 Tax=Litoribacterium kuwaitense TaxID=1398745 RepID=UPI0013ED16E2|nr:aldo/keto reductase [Litoribacterium kuwaitense]NGP46191.1 aldo/keto reductase [Litoribacterium kuwaitense]
MKKLKIKGMKDKHSIDIEISNIVMGSGDFLRLDRMDFAEEVLDKYIALGGNVFDTARHYRFSEKALGHWMEKRDIRDKVIVLTKGCHPVRDDHSKPRVNAKAIEEDLMTSLAYLKTDYVDLYALHRDDPTEPVAPIMEALHKHVEAGRIRAIGLSNWELRRVIEADQYAKDHGLTRISFTSPNLSLAKPIKPRWENCVFANEDMLSWHEVTQKPLLSWSSQAGGFFSGRFSPEIKDNQEMVDVYYSKDNWQRYERVIALAHEKGVSPIQISLAYVLNQSFPTAAIIGSENQEELTSSIASATIQLTTEEMNWLNLQSKELR